MNQFREMDSGQELAICDKSKLSRVGFFLINNMLCWKELLRFWVQVESESDFFFGDEEEL
jgi:hypothetical protein